MAARLYSLFERQHGRWVRISPLAFTKANAVRLYQSLLLTYPLGAAKCERSLRVVKSCDEPPAQPRMD